MDALRKGWFSELNEMWPSQAMSLEVQDVLHSEKSKFQDILIFQRSSAAASYSSWYCSYIIHIVQKLAIVWLWKTVMFSVFLCCILVCSCILLCIYDTGFVVCLNSQTTRYCTTTAVEYIWRCDLVLSHFYLHAY